MTALSACSNNINEGSFNATTVPAGKVSGPLEKAVFYPNSTLQTATEVIKPGDHFSITLISAFICDFRETGVLNGVFDASNSESDVCPGGLKTESALSLQEQASRGEIAILADYGSGTARAAGSSDIKDFGRVIYYNEDVRESGQLLNDIGIRIHGPIAYKNEVTNLRLAIVEFDDEENERAKAIIENLASVGGKAYPPAAAVLGVLSTLGKTVFEQNKNDVEFRGSIIFDPPSVRSTVARAPLQEGYYVFVRNEDRSEDFEWGGLEVCETKGLLMHKGCSQTYRDNTWLLLRVSREDTDVATVQNVGQEISEFLEAQSEKSVAEAKAVKDTFEELETTVDKLLDNAEKCADAKKADPMAVNPNTMTACST
ncbi:MAG: hypothetical protein AAGH74_15580 [Pseudomonadota bacterium]